MLCIGITLVVHADDGQIVGSRAQNTGVCFKMVGARVVCDVCPADARCVESCEMEADAYPPKRVWWVHTSDDNLDRT